MSGNVVAYLLENGILMLSRLAGCDKPTSPDMLEALKFFTWLNSVALLIPTGKRNREDKLSLN
jgi:hypothetical protein